MKGKDLNKRLRELRDQNEYQPVFIIDQCMELLSPELKKRGFTWAPFRKKTGVNSCAECQGYNVHDVLFTDSCGAGWYCKACKKLVEIKTKHINDSGSMLNYS